MDPFSEVISLAVGGFSAFLWWLIRRAVGRVDDIEKDVDTMKNGISELRVGQARDYHTKAEIKEIVASAMAPMLVSLRNIERQITGRSSLPRRIGGDEE